MIVFMLASSKRLFLAPRRLLAHWPEASAIEKSGRIQTEAKQVIPNPNRIYVRNVGHAF